MKTLRLVLTSSKGRLRVKARFGVQVTAAVFLPSLISYLLSQSFLHLHVTFETRSEPRGTYSWGRRCEDYQGTDVLPTVRGDFYLFSLFLPKCLPLLEFKHKKIASLRRLQVSNIRNDPFTGVKQGF